jgi:uncharacterized protein involved in exopolysaccharide biosynthesis
MSSRFPSGLPARGEASVPDAEGTGPSAPSLREMVSYVLHSADRQRWLVAAVFLAGMALTSAYYFSKTPLYRVETKVLAQRQQSLPSIARSALPDESPTRTAYEVVHRRENLVALLKQNDLIPAPGSEPRGNRLKAWLSRLSPTAPEREDAADEALNRLVLQLDKELIVTVGDGTITISLDWPNPEDAYHLVEAALQNFLEARQIHEITAIDDAISLLQERLAAARSQLNKVTDEAQRGNARVFVDPSPGRAVPQGRAPSEELQVLAASLEAKERSLRDLEELRRRRLMELQAQLDERRGVYSDSHPTIIALRKEVDAMSLESPQVTTLRDEASRIREEYSARLAEENRGRPPSSRGSTYSAPRAAPGVPVVEDQSVRDARVQYEQMAARVNAAKADLDTARAAFKYRYTVAWPARVPRKPVSPNPITIFGLGTVASLILALGAAVRPGIANEKVRERWQVERSLGVPVLADFDRK